MANFVSTHTGEQIESAITEGIKTGYGVCSTAAATVAKVVTINNSSFEKITGAKVNIKFSNNVCASATLNINGTAASPIYYNGAAIPEDIIKAGQIVTLVYDGTNYNLINSGANIKIDNTQQSSLTVSVTSGMLTIE